MSNEDSGTGIDAEGLRERKIPQHTSASESVEAGVWNLNSKEEHAEKDDKEKKTFGRTPNGTGE